MNDERMLPEHLRNFRAMDADIRRVIAIIPQWSAQQDALVQFLAAFPDALHGTPLEGWIPFRIDIHVEPVVPSASSPSGEPARKPLERPLRSAKLKVGQSRGKKKINGAAGDLAAALFQREGRLMSAAEVDAALRREGWPGFSHLEDQSIKMSVQTMYRALQSRKKQFAFFGNGLWGLKEWQKGGVPNAKGDAMT